VKNRDKKKDIEIKEANEEKNREAEETAEDLKTEDTPEDVKEEGTEKEEAPEEEVKDGEKSEEKDEGSGEASEENEEKKDPKDVKIEELNDKVMRQMAEFDNFRKRTEKEKEQMFEVGAKSIIEKILPIIDNFERALEMAGSEEGKEQDPFMDGMEKVYRQLMDELEKADVKPIEAVGKDFDPNLHNAVMQEESEEFESGKITKELQKGYMYRDSVVRHSCVAVAQ